MNSQVWIDRHLKFCEVLVLSGNVIDGENRRRSERNNRGRNQQSIVVTNCLRERFSFHQSFSQCGNMLKALRYGGRVFGLSKKMESCSDFFGGSCIGLSPKDSYVNFFGKRYFSSSNRVSAKTESYSDSFGSFESTSKILFSKADMTGKNVTEKNKTKTSKDTNSSTVDLLNREEQFFSNTSLQTSLSSQSSLQTSSQPSSPEPSLSPSQNSDTSSIYFEETVPKGVGKMRLDSYISGKMPRASRAKIQSCIKGGHVNVNGKLQTRTSYIVRAGEKVECRLPPPPPLEASPENIPLEVIYEDENVLVVNKPPHLVVHPSPGHYTGTLVNALLYHCKLPSMKVVSGNILKNEARSLSQMGFQGEEEERERRGKLWEEEEEGEEIGETEENEENEGENDEVSSKFLIPLVNMNGPEAVIRPGIVHRLDKGTSGLLVVAKDEYSHAHLCDQFKARSVKRLYISITCGVPNSFQERIETLIGRDPKDRKKMTASNSIRPIGHFRSAVSRYKVVRPLAGGGAALVEWKLETGRTHQIRVHAKHVGHPILGDEAYGGMGKGILGKLLQSIPPTNQSLAKQLMARLDRPCLHAKTLGFVHPYSGKELHFSADPPDDFMEVVSSLEKLALKTDQV